MRKFAILLLSFGVCMLLATALPSVFAASTNSTSTSGTTVGSSAGFKFLAAGIAFGLAAFGAGFGLAQSGAAAIAAVVEKPEVRTSALIFVALAEAIAIYGFVIAIIILGQPT